MIVIAKAIKLKAIIVNTLPLYHQNMNTTEKENYTMEVFNLIMLKLKTIPID